MSGRTRVLRPDCYFPGGATVPAGHAQFPNLTVTSIDVGTVNFAIGKVTLVVDPSSDGEKWIVMLEEAAAITLKNNDKDAPIEKIVENLYVKLNHPDMTWMWEDASGERTTLVVERQVDHIETDKIQRGKSNKGKAVMHAVYAALRMMELARHQTVLCLTSKSRAAYGIGDDAVMDELANYRTRFVPVSGHMKAGLRGVHGNDRKELTAPIALQMLEQDGQTNAHAWIGILAKQKPQEDVADVYLQGRRYLEDRHEERLKERRKLEREKKKRAREADKAIQTHSYKRIRL